VLPVAVNVNVVVVVVERFRGVFVHDDIERLFPEEYRSALARVL